MSAANAVAAILVIGLTMYAVFGGADFGAGFWSLLARGERDRRPRELIDWAIGPVWEANHVWLIFVLVYLWTGFSPAFEAPFFHEFAVRCPRPAAEIVADLAAQGILAGYPLGRDTPGLEDCLLIAVTERRTRDEIDRLAEIAQASREEVPA